MAAFKFVKYAVTFPPIAVTASTLATVMMPISSEYSMRSCPSSRCIARCQQCLHPYVSFALEGSPSRCV